MSEQRPADDPPRVAPRPLTTADGELDLVEVLAVLAGRWRLLVFGPLAVFALTFAVTLAVPPTFTATTVLLPPAQSSSSSLAALAGQLGGALGGLAGAAAGIKSPSEQYVALLKSRNVADRIVERFELKASYDVEFLEDARAALDDHVRVKAGARDGLITVEVDDRSPRRAADIANAYVDELRRMSREFAVGEAAQRRAFFEGQVKQTRDALAGAERALGSSGITDEALKVAPEAAVEALATVKAQVAAQQVKIASMRGFVADDHPDLRQAETELAALKAQLARVQTRADVEPATSGYAEKFREFKYQQTLFELVVQQYEVARLDEAREGNLIQVIDPAVPPERKSQPKRGRIALVTAALSWVGLVCGVFVLRAAQRPRPRRDR